MPRVVVTGGPGAGKTTLLAELTAMGHKTVSESARSIIAERKAAGLSARPSPLEFAREILRRDAAKYAACPDTSDWVFFDRSAVEGLAMLHEVSPLEPGELHAQLSLYAYYPTVFILPPWQAIYTGDGERDHSFAHAQRVHAEVSDWYRSCGYHLHEVPPGTVSERARQILHALGCGDA